MPILDLEQPAPEPGRVWLACLIGLLVGATPPALIVLADQNRLPDWHWPRFNGLLLLPALYIVVAIHEFGHLLTGSLVGIEPGGIAIGGFVFAKSGKNWVFRFDWRRGISGFFKPLMARSDFDRARYAWMMGGGPLASILSAALFATIFGLQGNGIWDWAGTLLWTSLAVVGLSLFPYSTKTNKSDGARLWDLLRRPRQVQALAAVLDIQTQEAKGVRPRDWNQQQFEEMLTVDRSDRGYLFCQLFAYYRRIDENNEQAALENLENALARANGAGKALLYNLFTEAACASANIQGRSAQARVWLDRAAALRGQEPRHVVEASIAMCEGRYEDAIQSWAAAQERVKRLKVDSGLVRFAKEKWSGYEDACRENMAATKRSSKDCEQWVDRGK